MSRPRSGWRRARHRRVWLLLAWLCSARIASAQTPSRAAVPDPVRFTTEIIVTPERGETPRADVPAATVVLERAALAAAPVVHPAEVAGLLAGFDVMRGQFHVGRPVLAARGFFGGGEAEYVLVLVDGVPLTDVESGLVDWSLVPVASIGRIEAVRGPGAAMYGDAAVGGVIQILTASAADTGQLMLTGGSFGSLLADGSYGRDARGTSLVFSGAARRTGGAFVHSAGRELAGGGSAEGRVRSVWWKWSGTATMQDRDDPGSLRTESLQIDSRASDPSFRLDGVERSGFSTAVTVRHAGAAWQRQARMYVRGRDEDLIRTILLAPGFGDTHTRTISSRAVGGSVEAHQSLGAARGSLIRYGVDLAHERIDTRYNPVEANGSRGVLDGQANGARLRAGLFAATSFEPASRVRLLGALRWDDVRDRGFAPVAAAMPAKRAWSPRAGVVLRLRNTGTAVLFAQVSRAFKAPTLDQLFDPRPYPDFRGGTWTISNRLLSPQRATNVEAGVSGSGPLRWSALVYDMRVDNEIDFDLRTFSYANIGRSRHRGVEVEAGGSWRARVEPSLLYAFTGVTDRSGAGRLQLKNIPRHRISAGASIAWPWSLALATRYTRSWGGFVDDANRVALDGPSRIDLRFHRTVGRHALFVDVLNATGDVSEEYGFMLADIRGGSVAYAYPGAPRAVRAGVSLSF